MTILNFDKLESPIRTLGSYINFNFNVKGQDEQQNEADNNAFVRYDFNHKYYLVGTNNSITGFYYPLYLKAPSEDENDYTSYIFLEYPGITFYMLKSSSNIGMPFKPEDTSYLNFLIPHYLYGTGNEGEGYYYPIYIDLPSNDSSKYTLVRFVEQDRDFYVLNNFYKKAETNKPDELLFKKYDPIYFLHGTRVINSFVGEIGYYYPIYDVIPSSNSDEYSTYNFIEYPGIDFYMLNNNKNEAKTKKPSKVSQLVEYEKTGWYATTLKLEIDKITNKMEIEPNEIAFISNENDLLNENNPDVESNEQVKLLEEKTLDEIYARALIKAYKQEWTYGYNRTYTTKEKYLRFIEFKLYKIENNDKMYIYWDYWNNEKKTSKNSSLASLFLISFYKETSYIKLIQNLHEKILLIDKSDENNHTIKFIDNNSTNILANLDNKLSLLPYQITKDSNVDINDDSILFTVGSEEYYIDYVY